ncbi:unnamed protein product, partial [marine sediment metagenome]
VDVLIPEGYVPFAKGPDVNYDPICFDLNAMTHRQDCPIIQFEHGSILCHLRIGDRWKRWSSFREFAGATIRASDDSELPR